MRGSSVSGEKHIQGNPLEFHLRMFAVALREAGYRDRTMCSKLRLLADLGHWLKRTGQSFASHLEEHPLEAFVKHKQRIQQMRGGDSKTLQQFLDGLRGDLRVVFEEGTWATWLYDLLKSHVTEVLVCNTRKNAVRKGSKSDRINARKLAEQLYMNNVKSVYHGERGLRMMK